MNQNRPAADGSDPRAASALAGWGWDRYALRAIDTGPEPAGRPGLLRARVVAHRHHTYDLVCEPDARLVRSQVSGAFSYRATGPTDYPTVGDWVLIDEDGATIQQVLPRATAISRKTAGEETLEQVIAANVDVVLLVFGMDGARGFTVGLLERAAATAWNSGARPIVVLNKMDLADEDTRDRTLLDAQTAAPGIDIVAVSARTDDGVQSLLALVSADETVGMLGKSGVGKTALLNAFGRMRNAEISAREGALRRSDLQGRHTTTDKQLYRLPGGPLIVDVPGLRELQLWADEDGLGDTFPEIRELAAECRFGDCSHGAEPGCRVQQALATGELPLERWEHYLDLQRELSYLNRRRDARGRAEEEMKWKKIAQASRANKGKWRGRG